MCLAAVAIEHFHHFPFVCIANRDEFHQRPTAPMQWWTPPLDGGNRDMQVLCGKDLQSGGTWLGFGPQNRFALLTNVRDPNQQGEQGAPSRGLLVTNYLVSGKVNPHQFSEYAGFNLLAGQLIDGSIDFFTNNQKLKEENKQSTLTVGIHTLSNSTLNEPWPKSKCIENSLLEINKEINNLSVFLHALGEALQSTQPAEDEDLPRTGVPIEWERMLSPVKIVSPQYGTRAQTILILDKNKTLHVQENTLNADGGVSSTVSFQVPCYAA